MLGQRSLRMARTVVTAKRLPILSTPYSSSSSCNPNSSKPIPNEEAPRSSKPTRSKPRRTSTTTLSLRRASLAHPRRRTPSTISSAAEYILDENAFKPVHLYPGQIALHTSFTPPHMPLPVHLGTSRYKSTRYNAASLSNDMDPFARPTPLNPVPFLRKLEGTMNQPTSLLTEHTGIRIMFDNPTHVGHLLPEHTITGPASPYNRLQGNSDLGVEVDFNRLMAHNASIGSESWSRVLASMDAAQSLRGEEVNTKAEVDTAVDELNALLEKLETEEGKDEVRRRGGGRRGQVTFHRRGKGIRMSRRELEVDNEEVMLDSVKRKRKKKISKHKYKKRRKATRSERKKLGK